MSWLFEEYDQYLKKNSLVSPDVSNLKLHIKYLQHERLVHLLVMLTVGLAALLTWLCLYLTANFYLLLPSLLLSVLFIAYLNYYRKLENTVQSWYGILEKTLSKS